VAKVARGLCWLADLGEAILNGAPEALDSPTGTMRICRAVDTTDAYSATAPSLAVPSGIFV